jgi:hypothetical protein
MSDTSGGLGARSTADDHPYVLEALPSDPDDPDGRCTFVPRDADGDECLTRWITADRGDVLELTEWR